jgi:uncharacterized protein (DUF111 family)
MSGLLLHHTTTLGVRYRTVKRDVLTTRVHGRNSLRRDQIKIRRPSRFREEEAEYETSDPPQKKQRAFFAGLRSGHRSHGIESKLV